MKDRDEADRASLARAWNWNTRHHYLRRQVPVTRYIAWMLYAGVTLNTVNLILEVAANR